VDLQMDDAITDGNFVSGPAWPAHPEFLRQFHALLMAEKAAS
jgi:protease I